jgi:hypothetical protein
MNDESSQDNPIIAAPPGHLVMQAQRAAAKRLVRLQHNHGAPIRVERPADPAARKAMAKDFKKFRRRLARARAHRQHVNPVPAPHFE